MSINHHRALNHFIVPINLIVLLLINHKLWVFFISGLYVCVCQCVFSPMSQWNDYQRKNKQFTMEIETTKTQQEKYDSAYLLAKTLFTHTLSQTAVQKPYDIDRLNTPIDWLDLILYTLIKQFRSFANAPCDTFAHWFALNSQIWRWSVGIGQSNQVTYSSTGKWHQ